MITERGNSGWILIFVALSLVVLCGFVALAVDVGGFLSARTSAQRAADAGALAGALTFVTGCGRATCDPKADAEDQAVKTSSINKIMGAPPNHVSAVADVGLKKVTVTVDHNAPIFFASVLGINIAPIRAIAVAEAANPTGVVDCVKPLFFPNTLHPANPCNDCTTSPQVIIDSSGKPTSLAVLGHSDTIQVRTASESLNKVGLSSDKSVFAITFGNDTQGEIAQYDQNILQCPAGARIACNMSYPVKSDSRINGETLTQFTSLTTANGPQQDGIAGLGQYISGLDGKTSSTSHQLITVPIFDVCSIPSFCSDSSPADYIKDSKLASPTQKIKVAGFARMFVRIESGKVKLYLVGLNGCGSLTPNPATTESGAYGTPVRLVNN